MKGVPTSPEPQLDLASQIRREQPAFVEQASKLLSEAAMAEYPRLRGYAYEAGTTEIGLTVQLRCRFGPGGVEVKVATAPEFTPPPLVRSAEVALPKQ